MQRTTAEADVAQIALKYQNARKAATSAASGTLSAQALDKFDRDAHQILGQVHAAEHSFARGQAAKVLEGFRREAVEATKQLQGFRKTAAVELSSRVQMLDGAEKEMRVAMSDLQRALTDMHSAKDEDYVQSTVQQHLELLSKDADAIIDSRRRLVETLIKTLSSA